MKRTRLTECLRNVQRKRSAFWTLCLIITLGLGGFFASRYAQSSMRAAGADFFRRSAFWDFELLCSTGVSRESLEEIRAVDGVEAAEGRFSAEAVYSFGETAQAVRALSLTKTVSVPQLTEGRLPENVGECLLDPDLLGDSGGRIGDTITLRASDEAGADFSGDYVVTGTAYHPDYLRRDSTYTVILRPEAFDPSGSGPYGSVSVLAVKAEEASLFSEEYFAGLRETKSALAACADSLREKERAELESRFPGVPLPEGLPGNWIVLDRRSNAGYTEYGSTIGAMAGAGTSFGLLFLLVTGMKCFSTVSLLVEEQKKLVGTEKAFGFRPWEILLRYLLFGVGAALLGSLLGAGLACGLGKLLLFLLDRTELYVMSAGSLVFLPWLTLAVSLGACVLCALAAALACFELLRSSADDLMKGRGREDQAHRTRARHRSRSLYVQLILRNALREKGRVAMAVIVTAVSCVLIGTSITVKLAYDGMNIRQLADVWLFDLRVDLGQTADAAVRVRLEETMDSMGIDWVPAGYGSCLFENEDRLDGALVLCAPQENLGRIIGLRDPATGETAAPGPDGMLIQYRMGENLKLTAGDSLTVLDTAFRRSAGRIAGFIQNYQKRIVALTPEYYRKLFGTAAPENSYFVTLNHAEDQTLRDALLSVSGDLGFERADSFYEQYRAIAFMYNAVVLGVTVIAVLISFVILVNIAAIFVSKRKRELIILRVNGFSLRKARGLLMSEAFATTLSGLLLGTLCGIPAAAVVVRIMETPDVMFVREVQPLAWVIAVLVETGFASLIYGSAMRRIRDYQLSDLADTF